MTKRVRVTFRDIMCNSVGSDDGGKLGIYGDLHAKKVYLDEVGDRREHIEPLWVRSEDQHFSLSELATMRPGLGEGAVPGEGVKEITIQPGEFLHIGGHLMEEDTDVWLPLVGRVAGDDDLGTHYVKLSYNDIEDRLYSLGFHNSEEDDKKVQSVSVQLETTVLSRS